MKRKIYATARERKIDQLIGFLAFPLVNLGLLAANWLFAAILDVFHVMQLIQCFAWSVVWTGNGLALLLAFLFRPHIGVGYLVAFGLAACASATMSILVLTACFGIMGAMVLHSVQNPLAEPLVWLVARGLPLAAALLFIIGVLILIVWWARRK